MEAQSLMPRPKFEAHLHFTGDGKPMERMPGLKLGDLILFLQFILEEGWGRDEKAISVVHILYHLHDKRVEQFSCGYIRKSNHLQCLENKGSHVQKRPVHHTGFKFLMGFSVYHWTDKDK
ncbi:hypothetical protein CEXT_377241 [Caerostris extrusa]|uniref:Uncharacterized protein n=1 Tax=Caerostris extrusa TaxID=172846 RepID=A0AAV4Y998_CAEEX|nr:hypothetical protein CEXT_377241 [Caerostris extrusa]